MSKPLDIVEFLALSQGHLTIDVRSPKEFTKGHIPHAINLPLFNDEERAKIGTIYKQTGRSEAIEAGLEIVGPKMADFVRFVKALAKDNKIFVHCWRGGMRSGSMAWLFDTMGYEVYTLRTGYKAYRHLVLEGLGREARYIIIGGRTGSGKTEILHTLREQGEQIIDLERLAHHKGSSFGALGELPQPMTEQFENNLYLEMSKLDLSKPIWLEDESKNIGKCSITNELWANMIKSPVVVIDIPLEVRVKRLVKDYGEQQTEGLEEAIRRIERRLGNEAMKDALRCLGERNFEEVARITLHYYDKAYDHSLSIKETKDITILTFDTDDMNAITKKLIGQMTMNSKAHD
jgi:tRNA 2-selenouridine synthase